MTQLLLLSATSLCSWKVACSEHDVQAAATPTSIAKPAATTPNLPGEKLGTDDLLEIYVADCPELSRSFRVDADGKLWLPLLPQSLPVAGLTPVEVAAELRDTLLKSKLLVEPVVNVSVLEYRSRPVSVVGAVVHPVTFQAAGHTTLMDAIATAGGFTSVAGGKILLTSITHAMSPGRAPDRSTRVIAVKDLVGGVDGTNPQLHGGEEISVPEAEKIFVAGNVIHPGAFPMQGEADITVVKAVTLSAGLAPFTASYALIYRRRGAGVERDQIRIPLTGIMKHREPDVALLADDILYVPASNGRRLTTRIVDDIAGFGKAAGGYAVIH